MKSIIKKTFYNTQELFKNHKRVLLMVSTGIDSMTLLNYFIELKDKLGIEEIGVLHINHKLRWQSDEEEVFIKEYCHSRSIPIYINYFKEKSFSEELARELRYNFARQIMNEYNYSALVTGHHKDDQSETIFMKIIRGSRLLDLGGIKERQAFNNGELIRPFLNIHKNEFPTNIEYYEDNTNLENNYFRNRIRNIYLPLLKDENSNIVNSLVSISQEVQSLNTLVDYFIKDIDYLDINVFRSYPRDIQIYFIQDYLKRLNCSVSKPQLLDIVNMLNSYKKYNNYSLSKRLNLSVSKDNWKIEVVSI